MEMDESPKNPLSWIIVSNSSLVTEVWIISPLLPYIQYGVKSHIKTYLFKHPNY